MSMFSFHKGKAVQQWWWCCQSKRPENALEIQQRKRCSIAISVNFARIGGDIHQ